MNVLFDHQVFRFQKYGGISLYISKLISGINSTPNNLALLTGPEFENEHLQKKFYSNDYLLKLIWEISPTKGLRSSNFYSKYSSILKKHEIFHPTYYNPYFLKNKGHEKPWTITFHDMIHENFGNYFPNNLSTQQVINHKNILAKKAPKIITISEYTKHEMVNYYQIDPSKIEVIYHGNPFEKFPINDNFSYNNSFPYLLYVGNRWLYKNFKLFIKSVSNLLKKYSIKVICAGGNKFTNDEINFLQENRLNSYVHYEPILNNNLQKLYRNSIGFIFPSLQEGFGFPILEALSCECLCAVSDNSCFPEIAGEGALYFDPYNSDSIENTVEKLILVNSNEKIRMIDIGLKRLEKFSWNKTVYETLSLYESIVKS